MDPALLDRLRRGFPLRMDTAGRFWFEGDPLEHPRVVAYFRAHIDATTGGEPIIRVDGKYVHFTCDDTPLRITHLTLADTTVQLTLDDDRVVPLDPSDVVDEDTAGILTHVPSQHSGRPLAARFTNRAAVELARWVEVEGELAWLHIGGQRFPVTSAAPAAPPSRAYRSTGEAPEDLPQE